MTPPLHIGILCDGDGSGPGAEQLRFAARLAEGLLTQPNGPRVTVVARRGRQHFFDELAVRWPRLRVLPDVSAGDRVLDVCDRLDAALARAEEVAERVRSRGAEAVRKRLARVFRGELHAWEARGGRPVVHEALAFRAAGMFCLLAGLGAGVWAGAFVYHLLFTFLLPTLRFPLRLGRRAFRPAGESAGGLAAGAGCDVWMLPRVAAEGDAADAAALFFDVVRRDAPGVDGLDTGADGAEDLVRLYRGSPTEARPGRAVAPFAAVRVHALPRPADAAAGRGPDLAELRRKYGLGGQFLFYPAPRRQANLEVLVRALARVRRLHDEPTLELACTGRPTFALRRVIKAEGLSGCVRFLGRVPAADVRALYRHALLAPLPSPRGGARAAAEALRCGCPVVCADVPVYRAFLRGFTEAVHFFDPNDASSAALAIGRTLAQHERYREWQQEAFRRAARPDWWAVGRDLLALCKGPYPFQEGAPARELTHVA